MPVREIEQARDPVAAQRVELGRGRQHRRVQRDGAEHDEQCREQAARPPGPEPGQADAAVPPPLRQQQRRDEEARQDEEDVDSEEPARRPSGAEVVRDDRRHRERAQAVERRLVANAAVRFHAFPHRPVRYERHSVGANPVKGP